MKPTPRELDDEEFAWVAEQLEAWFRVHGRTLPWRSDRATVYQVLLAEIFLQQTPAKRVAQFLPEFIDRYPDIASLAKADPSQLVEFLEPLGLHRRRAKRLLSIASQLHDTDLTALDQTGLQATSGIGPYATRAMLVFLQGAPEPLIDVNVARVIDRFAGPRRLVDIRKDGWLARTVRGIIRHDPRTLNYALIDLGALTCRPRLPLCYECPLKTKCRVGAAAKRQDSGRQTAPAQVRLEKP